jgi:release factor glutamine methyltransferase
VSAPGSAEPTRLIDYLTLACRHLEKKGIASPRLDAELLLAATLGLSRLELYTKHDRPLDRREVDRFRDLVRRRAGREPVAYITGKREFWSMEFSVDRRVLIPRPETELLVEVTLERLRNGSGPASPDSLRLLEIGTGSGAVAVVLATKLPGATVLATDASAAALEVAPANARAHGVTERIRFAHGDAFAPIAEGAQRERFHAIVSNPPYCGEGEIAAMEPEVREWEPRSALVSGHDGMDVTRRLVEGAPEFLEPGGWLVLEMGTQASATRELFSQDGWQEVATFSDLAGHPRVIAARRPQVAPRG